MSTPPQSDAFDATVEDQLMMEEIFELLAANSPSDNQDETTASTVASTNNSNHKSHSSSTNLTESTNGDEQSASFTGASTEDMEDCEEFAVPAAGQWPANDEYKPPADWALQFPQQAGSLLSVTQTEASEPNRPPMISRLPGNLQADGYATPRTNVSRPLLGQASFPDATPFPSPELPLPQSPSSLPQNSGASHILPTGQRLHVMNEAEFDELRRKLRMQTASRRYRKRKKEEARKKKTQIQELKAELARLQDLETQLKHYEQRSVESLEEELARHKQEVAELSVKVEKAAKEELDWINRMKAHMT